MFCAGSYYDYIIIPFATLAAASMIPPIFVYFRAYIKGTFKTTRFFFYTGASLFILIFCTLILMTPGSVHICNDILYTNAFRLIIPQLFIFQNLILIGWFLYKLEYIFRGSTFAVSKGIITSFAVIYILFCVFFITSGILWALHVTHDLMPIAGVLTVLLTIILVGTFICKLFKVFHGNPDPEILILMRKTAFLVFISTSFIFSSVILGTLNFNFSSNYLQIGRFIFFILDMYSSFWCIFLSFEYFDRYYIKMCGCIESKFFKICCKGCLMTQDEKNIKHNIKGTESCNKDHIQSIQSV